MAVALTTKVLVNNNNGSTTTTFTSYVSTANPLYVRVHWWDGGVPTNITSITFNGVALQNVVTSTHGNGGDVVAIYRLAAPGAVTANIVITFSNSTNPGISTAVNTTGQDTGTLEGSTPSASSSAAGTTTGNQTISGAAADDLVMAGTTLGAVVNMTGNATGGGTLVEEYDQGSAGEAGQGYKVPGAVTEVHTTFASNTWAVAAVLLKAQATPELYGLPHGVKGQNQMQQLITR